MGRVARGSVGPASVVPVGATGRAGRHAFAARPGAAHTPGMPRSRNAFRTASSALLPYI